MKSTVKNISVHYNPINETNTFTNGDFVSGQVTVEVGKECTVDSLSIKFKGKAEVRWTEQHGQVTVVYHAKDKYFSTKRFFIRGGKDTSGKAEETQQLSTPKNGKPYSSVLTPGSHVYPFTFQIPGQTGRPIPSSFHGSCGKIVYRLDTALSRSMRVDSKGSAKINFVSAVDPGLGASLMMPLHDSKHTKLKAFNRGSVEMDVNLEKTGYSPGEGMKIVAFVQNNSSRDIKLKYCVYRKHSFFAMGKRRVDTKDLLKESGDPIKPSANQTVTKVISIPHDAEPAIRCCSIIQAEYRLRVYLDVKYASDPEIKFPIIILPALTTVTSGWPAPASGWPAPAPASGWPAPAAASGWPAPAAASGWPTPAPASGWPAPASGWPAPAAASGWPAPAPGWPAPAYGGAGYLGTQLANEHGALPPMANGTAAPPPYESIGKYPSLNDIGHR